MFRYVKRPVEVSAIKLTPHNMQHLPAFFGADIQLVEIYDGGVMILTMEGPMRASMGSWIVRNVKGEYCPCANDVFVATYDTVQEPPPKPAPDEVVVAYEVSVEGYAPCVFGDLDEMAAFVREHANEGGAGTEISVSAYETTQAELDALPEWEG